MKNILGLVAAALAVVVVVVVWRTVTLESLQPQANAAERASVDRQAVSERLARSLAFRTISYAEPEQWESQPFVDFRDYLRNTFTHAHRSMSRELIGGHSLLYTWQGRDPELPPLLLMAHYDVVPVEQGTEDDWDHPPFGGVIEDGYVWGRGALDNKSGVMGILEAVDMLAAEGFEPRRTVLLAFGHDEEIGGLEGAAEIAALLEERGIQLATVLDEGGLIMPDSGIIEKPVALVGTAEKGYLSLRLRARGAGGHASQPPPRTAAGVIARAVDRLQSSPFPARYEAPTRDLFRYTAPDMNPAQRLVFANAWLFRPLILNQLADDHLTDAMIRTTTAPTMLRGSDKDNVLPIVAEAVVNFRLLPGDTVSGVKARVTEVIDDPRVEITEIGGFGTDPSPISPTDDPTFHALATTIGEIFPHTRVAPYLVVGATDSRHYQPLSDHVYRFLPFEVPSSDLAGLHGTNERLAISTYTDGIRFYRRLIINMAE